MAAIRWIRLPQQVTLNLSESRIVECFSTCHNRFSGIGGNYFCGLT